MGSNAKRKYSDEELAALPFRDASLPLEERVDDLLGCLTRDEKFQLLSGSRIWTTRPIKRLGIPRMRTTDGPLGVARHSSYRKNTRFPASILVAATWNPDLAYRLGVAMGAETRAVGRHVILAPGINIGRTPLNGRTFEYLTEDPFLNKTIAIPLVKGIQSNRVAACVKHFAVNNQEYHRFHVNAVVAERPLHEIYLRAYRAVVREADPWTFMACYNRVNGAFGCESEHLLRELLMDRFGFQGAVMSDWFATRKIERTTSCIKAGLSLEMPRKIRYKPKRLQAAFEAGEFTEADVDFLVRRTLRVMVLVGLFDDPETLPAGSRNTPEHQQLAEKIATEGMVLLKNANGLLPLNPDALKTLAVVGPNAKKKLGRLGYGGSSAVVPPHEVTPKKGLEAYCKARGVKVVSKPAKADMVVYVGGLDHGRHKDSEGNDRYGLRLPEKQLKDLHETIRANPRTVVVLVNGSPLSMDSWLYQVPAVLEAWYAGMEGGHALAKVLFGEVVPSGKLPVTFPRRLDDSPAHASFASYPGDKNVHYTEGIHMGYRHYDARGLAPLFPFGFGLSYTTFAYADLTLVPTTLEGTDAVLEVTFTLTNTGEVAGKEVAQVYAHDVEAAVERPPRELVGFAKVALAPGKSQSVTVQVPARELAYYDPECHDWVIEPGEFLVSVGGSSRDRPLEGTVSYAAGPG